MGESQFRFYEELSNHLPPMRQRCSFEHGIEALGVPHTVPVSDAVAGCVPARVFHRCRFAPATPQA